jgi:cell division protein ZapA
MPNSSQFVEVKVMGYDFRVACPAAEVDLLKQAVALLNQRIEEIRTSGKIVGAERIALMAALSLSHDYLKRTDAEAFDIPSVKRRIEAMNNLIDTAFTQPIDQVPFLSS